MDAKTAGGWVEKAVAEVQKRRRLLLRVVLPVVVGLLVVGKAAGWVIASKVQPLLGEGGKAGSLRITLSGAVSISGLELGATPGWPAERALVIGHASVRPAWSTILSKDIRIHSVSVDDAYFAVRRTAKGVEVVPTLTKKDKSEPEPKAEPEKKWDGSVQIDRISIDDSVVEFFDEKGLRKPVKLRVEEIDAKVSDVLIPALSSKTMLELKCRIKGNQNDATLDTKGWVQLDTLESSLESSLQGLDLTSVEPYIDRKGDLGMQRGLFDLQIASGVNKRKLDAKGNARLRELSFDGGQGAKGAFLGVPKVMLVKVMEGKSGVIDLDFRLNGNIDDPKFSLDEALPMRLAVGMAETVGLSVKGLVTGVGTIGSKGFEAVGGVAKGIGGLFGGKKDEKPAEAPSK